MTIGPRVHSAVLTDVMNSSARCFIASLSGTGKKVRDGVGVLLLCTCGHMNGGFVFFEFGYEKEKHLKQSSLHGATCPLECSDGVTCHLAQ